MRHQSLPIGYKNAEVLHKRLHTQPESIWRNRGQRRVLRLFHDMAERVPAYTQFLKEHGIDPAKIRTIQDFSTVPTINKDNYLRKYKRADLCWDGVFAEQDWVISTTSGSTGQPYYFPRTDLQDKFYATSAELYLRNNFDVQNKTTLYIDAFPMGAWIGGVFTYESIRQVAAKGYPISIITPGIHKQEIINAVKQLGSDFDQIVIGAYAPFLKDILDDGSQQGIEWQSYKVGFVFSAEAFTEAFRDYVVRMVQPDNIFKATLNHYGTVDLGTMAHETPESVMIRRQLVSDDALTVLFPEQYKQPTFAQYDPSLFYFEEQDNNLICSSFSGLPLVRYDLKDYGGILRREGVKERLTDAGYDLDRMLENSDIAENVWNLPYVYVYERNDFSVSYYAALVYPDTIRRALDKSSDSEKITGKFAMEVDYDKDGQQRLNIHVELKSNVPHTEALCSRLRQEIHASLLRESSEYLNTYRTIGNKFGAIVHLWGYEDPKYFKPGAKQKWVVK